MNGPIVLLISCLAISQVAFAALQVGKCNINVKIDKDKESRALLVSSSNPPSIIYAKVSDPSHIVLKDKEEIQLVCPARSNQKSTANVEDGVILVKGQSIETNRAKVKCVGKDQFQIQEEIVKFSDISCEARQRASYGAILRKSSEKCDKGERYEIGYDLGQLGFLKTIELCHDVNKAKTLWAKATIEPTNNVTTRFTGDLNQSFKIGDLYVGMMMSKNEPYKPAKEHDRLTQLIGASKADVYMSPNLKDGRYLAKGHLIANADKIYKTEQESTYFYANVVPMWQKINAPGGNWYAVENYVRQLASSEETQLDVYVGGLGTLQLEKKDLTLYRGDKIPVPKVLFKCVVDRTARKGLCFLIANNPYVATKKEADDNYVLCKKNPVCDAPLADHAKFEKGYMYCCNVDDFYRATQQEVGLEELNPATNKIDPMSLAPVG